MKRLSSQTDGSILGPMLMTFAGLLLLPGAQTVASVASVATELEPVTKNRYLDAPLEFVAAPNAAIVSKKLLDRVADFNWTERTIENPAAGIGVFGAYELAPMSIIETDEGLFAFDAWDTVHDGELTLEASRTVTQKPANAIIYGHSDTVMGTGVIAGGNKDVMTIGHPALNDVVASNLGAASAPSL